MALKQSTGFKKLDRELQKKQYTGIIESFDDEGADGYWIYLNGHCGYGNDGRHTVHEHTIGDLIAALRDIRPCGCAQCQQNDGIIWGKNTIT